MTDEPPALAALTTADLDPATLDDLFADLATLTRIDAILVRGAAGPPVAAGSLDEAHRRLAEAGTRGVQLHYRWDGESWLDTLIRTPGGIRLIRCRTPS